MANKNKVEFGLKNVHVAFETSEGQWEKPTKIPGAISFSPDVETDSLEFYADDVAYYTEEIAGIIKGELEMALFPDLFLSKALGYKKTSDGAVAQLSGGKKKKFILLFEGDGDKNKNRYVFLNCGAGEVKEEFKTNEKGKTIKVQKIGITVEGLDIADTRVMKLKYAADETGYSTLFSQAPNYSSITLAEIQGV